MLFCPRSLFSFFDLFWKTRLLSVLFFRFGLTADPCQAFYLNADLFPCQDLPTRKDEFLLEKFTLCTVGNTIGHKTDLRR